MLSIAYLKIIIFVRNTLSVSIPVLGLIWLWATKQAHWLKDYMEPTAMVVGALIVFCQFLITHWGGGLIVEKNKFYNIPNTKQYRDWLAQAKSLIADGTPDEALKILSAIKIESITTLVALLSGRWADYRRGYIAGVLEHTDKTFIQISKDVLSLILALEAEMNIYGKVDKEVREYLQKRYAKRLEQKLANRQPINLRRLPNTDGTSEETAVTFVTISAEEVKAHIAQVFQAAYGRLLITGKPGAGKTVLLLQLELALLESETDLLPVILNLATWKKDYVALELWLKELLPVELGANKKYVADILQQNRLILLLDGLDEVEESNRTACLEAIGRYREATDSQYVITSRIEEYRAITKDAPVNLQIEVGDLTLDQMVMELTRMGHQHAEAIPLLNALKNHSLLREAAQVPFYFNTLQLLFAGGKTLSDLALKGSTVEAIREELTPLFVSYALTIPSDKNYTPQQAERGLSFLANNMTKRNKVVFELADLQYDWSHLSLSRGQLFVANYISKFVAGPVVFAAFGLAGGLVCGLACGLAYGRAYGLVIGLIISIVLGLVFALLLYVLAICIVIIFSKTSLKIETRGKIKWSWWFYWQNVKSKAVFSPIVLIIVYLVLGIFYGVSALAFGFVGSLAFSLIGGFFDYIKSDSVAVIQIVHPYQRFKNSTRMLHFSILQYWHLMYIFNKKGLLPLQIVLFLNDMVAQRLLESPDGATWRFRHRILQEHFSKKWETTE
jgi:hypothetical protein